ncbi:MAG: hypothetical protein ACQEWV_08820 [Bacillota bacterium]
MYIFNSRKLAQEKLEHIKNGFSAYVESPELANLIKKEIQVLKLDVYEDNTEFGFWFIPNREKKTLS